MEVALDSRRDGLPLVLWWLVIYRLFQVWLTRDLFRSVSR